MIKMVVSDMDGTLLSSSSDISHGNLETIHQLMEQHINFVIATGRDYEGVCSIMNRYGIQCEAILGNGAQYVDKDGKVLMSCYMDKSNIKDIVSIFTKSHIPYMIFTTNGFYTGHSPEFVRQAFIQRSVKRFHDDPLKYEVGGQYESSPCNHLQHISDFDAFLKQEIDIIKVEAFSLTHQQIKEAHLQLQNISSISYLSSFDDNIEVTHQEAQKGYILEKVIQQKGISKEEVIVLGDGMNDLSLFECFPYSYAPQNAEQQIKKLAYRVVKDCKEDGFQEAVQDALGI